MIWPWEPLTSGTALGRSRDLLGELEARHGRPGLMARTMAHSPALLDGYLALSRAMRRVKLSRAASERISLAVQARVGCDLCLDAHRRAAEALGLSRDEIARAEAGHSADPRHDALIRFALQVLTGPSGIDGDTVAELLDLGVTRREVGEVVGIVVLNQLTGSFNLVAGVGRGRAT